MPLKLMYITNDPKVAIIAENAGVDRIFVDLEYIGKQERQGGMDTVQSHHKLTDIPKIKSALTKAELLVRCNPIHAATSDYTSSKEEIDAVCAFKPDIIMLPFFSTVSEVEKFIGYVNGRAKTMLLVETPGAVANIDDILKVHGIDEVFIGLNDLSLGYGKKFMFGLLADGTVEKLAEKFKAAGITFGFGGIASLGHGLLPSEMVIKEHYRLGSSGAILSRSFCNTEKVGDIEKIREIFDEGLKAIRELERECQMQKRDGNFFADNRLQVVRAVQKISLNQQI